jgi:ketosteroid isomerase-like protein
MADRHGWPERRDTERAMWREKLDLLRRGLEAYARRDVQGMCDVSHEECELFTFTEGAAEAEPFRGHAGIAEWITHEWEPWEVFRIEPVEIREVRARVLVRTLVTARGKGSSVELSTDSGLVFEFRQRKIMRVRSYLNWHEALEALALRE